MFHNTTTVKPAKRVFALAAASALSLSLFAGCSFGMNSGGTPQPAADSQGSDAQGADDQNSDDLDQKSKDDAVKNSDASDAGGAADDQDGGTDQDSDVMVNYPEPIFTNKVPFELNTDKDAHVLVHLHQLKREGDIVTAYVSFEVVAKESINMRLYKYFDGEHWAPYLVDKTNLNRHGVLRTSGGTYAMTDTSSYLSTEKPLYAYATFTAPPEDVKVMDVFLVDGQPAAEGMEISE